MKTKFIFIAGLVFVFVFCLFIFNSGFKGIHGNIAGYEDLELESIGKEALGELSSFNLNTKSFIFLGIGLVILFLLWFWFRFKNKNGENK